ncbi:type Z 30S ribosomal protein S14 [Candidatus Peregrinibacteria bacterium]|jgi:small subunit ribosomal protein S14|nr:type Z 30S ribosomal protein S14 [Candidatus Peregrinibacteria bacterium]MBT7484435.1 type Z 30S ribosomal protein S14 [Candidatus Peregrinibacteria bacterium]MBT7703700.1 type Z 30S ribosomal protein S14 [Candidatus Peregrinibacteria bacterium]
MARKALVVKCARKQKQHLNALKAGKKPKHPTRIYNRCGNCGRIGSYMRRFGLCRICFRKLASNGLVMGVRKSSW